MPKIAVIMPAYQAAETIGRAIESVRAQTFSDWELLVVDDGSVDATGEIAAVHARDDARVRVLAKRANVGAAAAMNRAWRDSSAPFVAIMDADDFALPGRLARQVDFFSDHADIDVLGGAAHFVDGRGRYLRSVTLPETHEALERRRWYACPFVHPTVMMRRRFLETTGGYEAGLRLGEDYDLWMRGFFHGGFNYANLSDPLVIYRARPKQRWKMIRASAAVRMRAGRRERKVFRGWTAATRILLEGAVEQTGIFAWRDEKFPGAVPPDVAAQQRSP